MGNLRSGPRGSASGHDRGYKLLFSDPTLLEELLRGFLPEDWTERLDFTTLERVGNSFVSADLRERHSDLIWRLRLRGDGEGWVYLYLLLEFQSTSDRFMAVRLLTYIGLLLEEIVHKEKLKPGDRLPAVLPLVLYNGERRWRAPLRLESLFVPVPAPLRRHLPRLTYRLLDERRLDLNRPELEENRTAALFRIETFRNPADIPHLTRDLAGLLPREEEPELRRKINVWLRALLHRSFPGVTIPETVDLEEIRMFEERVREWEEKFLSEGRHQGRQEGRHEGQLQGMQEILLQQMTLRFGRLPAKVRRQIAETSSLQELRRLGRKVLRAKSLQEMGLLGCSEDSRP